MIVEDPARKIEQLADEWVTQRVSHRQAFLLRRDDTLIPNREFTPSVSPAENRRKRGGYARK
jgi:hypothetical protein